MNHHPPRWLVLFLVGLAASLNSTSTATADEFDEGRLKMVRDSVVANGVKNPRVIEAMKTTPRHQFVPLALRKKAHADMALPIGESQTISPPFIVAFMTEQIDPKPEDKVLEIGTGSGYQAAVLSAIVKQVYTIEIVAPLGRNAASTLKRLGYKNVFTKIGDGYKGWPEHAPFDKIIVTCSPENVPQALADQLKEGGRMVIPVGERYQQTMYLFTKKDGKLAPEALRPTYFVPMTGEAEHRRVVKPDPANPKIENGGFEDVAEKTKLPAAWYYERQMKLVSEGDVPAGKHFAQFSNADAGRECMALQGFAVDGRKVKRLDVKFKFKLDDVRPGHDKSELPVVAVTFFDERRAPIGEAVIGPWLGAFDWRDEEKQIEVPPLAREAGVRIGLFGAVGTLSIDEIEIKKAK